MIEHPALLSDKEKQLLTFWKDLKGHKSMPTRSDFTPENLAPWISGLHLLEVLHDNEDFQYRVHANGNEIICVPEMTGKKVSDWDGERRDTALDLYRSVSINKSPIISAMSEKFNENRTTFRRICLPFGEQNRVDHILSFLTLMNDNPETDLGPSLLPCIN